MSANLWEAKNVTPAENPEDGIYACSGYRGVRTNVSLDKLAANQTFHCGFSVNPGKDDKFNMALCYRDAAGYVNYVWSDEVSATAGKWTRVSGSAVIPSGMTVYQIVVCNSSNASGTSGWKVTNPTLSLGSPIVLAISSSTLAWSAGILATTRYYQLAAPTAATPTVPTSSSSLGSWTETEPTADVTKVLWTCERTVYADGTESWSKASKSTSYEAAKDAKSTATDAQTKAAALATVIHDGADGVSVGRSADGGATYPQGRTRQSGSSFEVLDAKGDAISSLSGDEVSLARGTTFLRTMVGQDATGTPAPQWSLLTSLLSCPIYIGKRDEAVGYEDDVTPEQLAAYIAFSAVGTNAGRIAMHAAGGAELDGRALLTGPTVLFDNVAQALDTAIYLSDSAANYKRLKIFYVSDDNEWSSVEVYDPDGKEVSLWVAHYNHGGSGTFFSQMWMKSKTVTISGRVIDTSTDSLPDVNYNRGQWNGRSTWEDRDKIGIKRVEGYAW